MALNAERTQRVHRIALINLNVAHLLHRLPFSSLSYHLTKLIEQYLVLRIKHSIIAHRLRHDIVNATQQAHFLDTITRNKQEVDLVFTRFNAANTRNSLVDKLDDCQEKIREIAILLSILNDVDKCLPFELHDFEYWL